MKFQGDRNLCIYGKNDWGALWFGYKCGLIVGSENKIKIDWYPLNSRF